MIFTFDELIKSAVPMILKERTRQGGDCILWTGCKRGNGYGKITFKGKGIGAHRAALMLKLGRVISSEEHALHTCDTPLCINPDHLWLGSHQDNMKDLAAKGRGGSSQKTHCPQGHAYDLTYKNQRHCFTCRKRANERFRQRRTEAGLTMRNEAQKARRKALNLK